VCAKGTRFNFICQKLRRSSGFKSREETLRKFLSFEELKCSKVERRKLKFEEEQVWRIEREKSFRKEF
jgi:hypothetical protein